LIPSYGSWPPHDTQNVQPFIQALSTCVNVDLVKPGTDVNFIERCVPAWMAAQGYPHLLIAKTYKAPDFLFIEDEIKRSENVILLLGFWEQEPTGGWHRIGGHYVTCAGVCSESLWIAISDPYFDYAEGGLGLHGPTVHNDAQWISGPHGTNWHDRYVIDTSAVSPGGDWWIPGYPITPFAPVATANFGGLNTPEEFVPQEGPWQGGIIYTEVEYAVAISPCPVVLTGDVNVDGVLTSADIIYMVNHVFKGGPAPLPCSAAGDVNCDGSLTSADIIYLVNHVFKGGPPPCDVCRLIAAGTWTCP